MNAPRLQLTSAMQRYLDYPRFQSTPRMLILGTEYFFDTMWVRAAERLGWHTATVRSAMQGVITQAQVVELFTTLVEFKPDFIITSNFAGMDAQGVFSRFFEDARIPYVSWFTDSPRMVLFDREVYCSHYTVAATWERAYEPHFRDYGFQHVHFMPHATDPDVFNAEPDPAATRTVFVGVSNRAQAADKRRILSTRPDLLEAADKALDAGLVNRDTIILGLNPLIAPDLLASCDSEERRNLELYMIYEQTSRSRIALVQRLIPHGIEVCGDDNWRAILPHVHGEISYFQGMPSHYRSTAVNLNITSVQMPWSVNQRVFDCPAAGGFLITDAQEDLFSFFDPDTEMVTYKSLDELEDKVRFFASRPDERARIVHAARKRILAEHTHAHRLQTLEAYLRERYA